MESTSSRQPGIEMRPWGSWRVIDISDGHKIKRIDVLPHARMSYQVHQHRSEHWVVARGTATCTVDGIETVVRVGESIDVAAGAVHRIANAHANILMIIEVQVGDYTGEDDVFRFDAGSWRHAN